MFFTNQKPKINTHGEGGVEHHVLKNDPFVHRKTTGKKSHQLHGPHLRHESRTRGRTSVHQDATNGAAWLPIPDIPAMVGILGHQNIETPTDPRSWMFLYTVGNLHLYLVPQKGWNFRPF